MRAARQLHPIQNLPQHPIPWGRLNRRQILIQTRRSDFQIWNGTLWKEQEKSHCHSMAHPTAPPATPMISPRCLSRRRTQTTGFKSQAPIIIKKVRWERSFLTVNLSQWGESAPFRADLAQRHPQKQSVGMAEHISWTYSWFSQNSCSKTHNRDLDKRSWLLKAKMLVTSFSGTILWM